MVTKKLSPTDVEYVVDDEEEENSGDDGDIEDEMENQLNAQAIEEE
jgi:hypothetical protein